MATVIIPAGTIPSASTLRDQILADVNAAIGQNIPALSKAILYVFATALGGLQHLAYRFGAWCLNQIFPQTADMPQLQLIGGRLNPPLTPNAAVAAAVSASATGQNGTMLPAYNAATGQGIWSAGGLLYSQGAVATISGGVAAVALTCLTPGSAGNLGNGAVMQLLTPVAGADGTATVTATTTTGTDAETQQAFCGRIMAAMGQPVQGSAAPDYIGWALQVAGVLKAFPVRTAPGFVTVYLLPAPGNATVLPSSGLQTAVYNYLNDTRRRPFQSNVLVAAPTVLTLNLTLSGMGMTSGQQAQAQADLTTYCLAAFPRQYPDQANPTDWITALAIAGICQADGATGGTVTLAIPGKTLAGPQYQLGGPFSANSGFELIALGTITWS